MSTLKGCNLLFEWYNLKATRRVSVSIRDPGSCKSAELMTAVARYCTAIPTCDLCRHNAMSAVQRVIRAKASEVH